MSLYNGFAAALREIAGAGGDASDASSEAAAARNALAFVDAHGSDIEKALARFGASGRLSDGSPLPASTYNDFYKWTMAPVIKASMRARSESIVCTFSANIRDVSYRQKLLDSTTGKAPAALFDAMVRELTSLTKRPFDRDLFDRVASERKLPGWDKALLDTVCGSADAPRMLVTEVVITPPGESVTPAMPKKAGDVVVHIFVANDEKLGAERVYVEATGPWTLVSWLETSMMQAIYEPLFRDAMRARFGVAATVDDSGDAAWYPKWLAEAFVRCGRSAAVIKELGMPGMVMTGRRTGGFPLILLQAMFLAPTLKPSPSEPSKLIGTSSTTAHYWLKDTGVDSALVPVASGTHAHELSMVLGSVLGELDDRAGLPLSQIVGHMLYFYLSVPHGDVKADGRKNLMPMLPDTLGTKAFMTAAQPLKVPHGPHKGDPVLSVIGMARQDSGTLEGFKELLAKYEDFKGALMASEIEVPEDLFKAKELGYVAYGAGGFYGDSLKAWDKSAKNISMAIKVLRVYVSGERSTYEPVKTGDPSGSGEGKFEADGLLSPERMAATRDRAKLLGEAKSNMDATQLQAAFDATMTEFLGDAVAA